MANSTPPSQVQIPTSNTQPSVPPSRYRGIYLRKGKWVAQVYNGDNKMIYIGTYSRPEMAAIAYDVAFLAFRGDNAVFNFPDKIRSHPVPKSNSIVDIRAAAKAAALQFGARPETMDKSEVPSQEIVEYVDEDELFNMPQVLIEMAEGLMVSPPRLSPPESNEPPEVLEDDNLWSLMCQKGNGLSGCH